MTIICFEVYYGIFRNGSKSEKAIFEEFLEGILLRKWVVGQCKWQHLRFFEKRGEQISNEDAIIMATGIVNEFKIITKDKKWKLLEEVYPRILILETEG